MEDKKRPNVVHLVKKLISGKIHTVDTEFDAMVAQCSTFKEMCSKLKASSTQLRKATEAALHSTHNATNSFLFFFQSASDDNENSKLCLSALDQRKVLSPESIVPLLGHLDQTQEKIAELTAKLTELESAISSRQKALEEMDYYTDKIKKIKEKREADQAAGKDATESDLAKLTEYTQKSDNAVSDYERIHSKTKAELSRMVSRAPIIVSYLHKASLQTRNEVFEVLNVASGNISDPCKPSVVIEPRSMESFLGED
mmetsp:Transcript_38617/g.75978  ORF Transcript_38617/g.75978 Transcript_38617/m.75978 type:complete len:256 (-) Transcript_38617:294-1061(-)|eukprot:CAMPEP_0175151072 /NCGR_PEP_ID=MMETSP0087-20121206/18268_1 /TAXON_ID=136419 /ORGANISM="Unknown Unknown, Strain D1" /LENGTH=255 /DNA_ID=CAMNT_0016437179 /DNA_START=54 /DNA_END=821 /DNA_ORIENTATION=+